MRDPPTKALSAGTIKLSSLMRVQVEPAEIMTT